MCLGLIRSPGICNGACHTYTDGTASQAVPGRIRKALRPLCALRTHVDDIVEFHFRERRHGLVHPIRRSDLGYLGSHLANILEGPDVNGQRLRTNRYVSTPPALLKTARADVRPRARR